MKRQKCPYCKKGVYKAVYNGDIKYLEINVTSDTERTIKPHYCDIPLKNENN